MPGIKYIRTLLRANPFTLVLKHAQQTTAGVAAVQPTSANIHVHAHIHTWPDDSQFMCARMWFIGERRGDVSVRARVDTAEITIYTRSFCVLFV